LPDFSDLGLSARILDAVADIAARGIEKLTRYSLRAIPLAIPAPRNDPIERPAKTKLPRDTGLASRQTPVRG
jgi:hypothetical protein